MALATSEPPLEDRLARQREIFEVVAPLILKKGTRRLSMSEAADVASLSIGGLYHYFPSKHDLLLHALQPEAIARCCQDFRAHYEHLADTDMAAYADAYFRYAARQITFFRPAVHAALEIGVENLWDTVTAGMSAGIDDFGRALHRLAPQTSGEHIASLGPMLRQVLLAALLDKELSPEDLERQLRALVLEQTGISTRGEEDLPAGEER